MKWPSGPAWQVAVWVQAPGQHPAQQFISLQLFQYTVFGSLIVSKRGGRLELKTNIEDSHFSGSASGVPHHHVQKSIPPPCVWLQLADIPFYSAFCLIKEPFRAWHFLFVTLHICCKQTPSHPSFWKAKYTESLNSLSARLFLPPSSHFCVSAL